jgi:hypothetical protein
MWQNQWSCAGVSILGPHDQVLVAVGREAWPAKAFSASYTGSHMARGAQVTIMPVKFTGKVEHSGYLVHGHTFSFFSFVLHGTIDTDSQTDGLHTIFLHKWISSKQEQRGCRVVKCQT